MSRTKGPSTQELMDTSNDILAVLATMLACMSCPLCDGTGRVPSPSSRGATAGAARVERTQTCECREEAQRLLADLADDVEGDEDEEEDTDSSEDDDET